jgi:hypothetical protein
MSNSGGGKQVSHKGVNQNGSAYTSYTDGGYAYKVFRSASRVRARVLMLPYRTPTVVATTLRVAQAAMPSTPTLRRVTPSTRYACLDYQRVSLSLQNPSGERNYKSN